MKMGRDACAGGLANIESHVKALRSVGGFKGCLTAFSKVHHLVGRLFVGFAKVTEVLIGNDHQMSRSVWIDIQNYEVRPGPEKDKFFLVSCRVVKDVAKYAADFRVASSGLASYIAIAPWTPQYIHDLKLAAARVAVSAFVLIYQFL